MADQTVMHVNENTPEYVAYRLMREILAIENREIDSLSRGDYLDTYSECLAAVNGKRGPRK